MEAIGYELIFHRQKWGMKEVQAEEMAYVQTGGLENYMVCSWSKYYWLNKSIPSSKIEED